MRPAAERLRERLAATPFAPPRIALVSNVDVEVHADPQALRDALYRQAFGPVRWVDSVHKMIALGATAIVECGPGKVLAGLAKRIAPQTPSAALFDPASLRDAKGMLA